MVGGGRTLTLVVVGSELTTSTAAAAVAPRLRSTSAARPSVSPRPTGPRSTARRCGRGRPCRPRRTAATVEHRRQAATPPCSNGPSWRRGRLAADRAVILSPTTSSRGGPTYALTSSTRAPTSPRRDADPSAAGEQVLHRAGAADRRRDARGRFVEPGRPRRGSLDSRCPDRVRRRGLRYRGVLLSSRVRTSPTLCWSEQEAATRALTELGWLVLRVGLGRPRLTPVALAASCGRSACAMPRVLRSPAVPEINRASSSSR